MEPENSLDFAVKVTTALFLIKGKTLIISAAEVIIVEFTQLVPFHITKLGIALFL